MHKFLVVVTRTTLLFVLLVACSTVQLQPDPAFDCRNCEKWNVPQTPFRIHGQTYFVGTKGLSAILVATEQGLILFDGGLPQTAPQIDNNIRKLGFSTEDLSLILVSHVHYDHVSGIAALQRLSGAKVLTSSAGAIALSLGKLQQDDPQFSPQDSRSVFPASANVITVVDGQQIAIGDATVTAVYTPGHTPGGISWAWQSCEYGKCLDIVYADSLSTVSADGFLFSTDPAGDLMVSSSMKIAAMDCDIFLSPHPFFFSMQEKLEQGGNGNAFIDSRGCAAYAKSALSRLEKRLQLERGGG